MRFFDWLRRPRLVPIAEFSNRKLAAAAWSRLQEAEIPASIDADPGLLGGRAVNRIMVEAPHVEAAQRLIVDLVRDDSATTS